MNRSRVLLLAILVLLAPPVPAGAADINDVYNLLQTVDNKVTATKQNTVTIENVVNFMSPRLQDTQARVQSTQTTVGTTASNVVSTAADVLDVRARVTTVQDKVLELGTHSAQLIRNMTNGVAAQAIAALAGTAKTFLEEAIADIQTRLDEEMEGRDDFINNHAAQFRADLIAFLTDIEGVITKLSEITGTNLSFNLTREKNLVSNLPARALYPMYRVLQVTVDFPKLTVVLSEARAHLTVLQQVFADPPNACQLIEADPEAFAAAANGAKVGSAALKLLAMGIHAIGDKTGEQEFTIGAWGWVLATIKINVAYAIATVTKGIGEGLEVVGDAVEKKLHHCEIVNKLDLLMADLADLETLIFSRASQSSVDALGTMVSSRASQSSVDALATTLGGLNTAPLDVAVSTRASQAGLDLLATQVDTHQSMMLRLQVELQLSDNTRHPAVFFLPEALGGKLGYVRAVVTETIATNMAAGLYSGALAEQELQNGDNAAATNDYRGAFDSYRRAYQEVTKWPVSASIELGEEVRDLALNWPSDPGGIYRVELSTDLVNWDIVVPKVVGDARRTRVSLTASGPAGFYRVFRLSSYDPTGNRS